MKVEQAKQIASKAIEQLSQPSRLFAQRTPKSSARPWCRTWRSQSKKVTLQFKGIALPKMKFRSHFFDSAVDHGKNFVHILFGVCVKLAISTISENLKSVQNFVSSRSA